MDMLRFEPHEIEFKLIGRRFVARTDGTKRVLPWPAEDAGQSCLGYRIYEELPEGGRWPLPFVLTRSEKGWVSVPNKFVGYWSTPEAATRMHEGGYVGIDC